MAQAVVEAAEGYSCSLLRQLWQMRTQWQMTDLTIHTRDGGSIPCHANVMAAASEYFRQLLQTPDLKEEIQLNFEEGHVLSIVEYCYKGRLTLTIAAAESHLRIADDFHLHELKHSIEEFVCENMTLQSSLAMYSLAKEFKLDHLQQKCQQIAASNLNQLTEAAEFHGADIETLSDIVSSVESADTALEACVAWATSNPLSRGEDFLHLMAQVQLAQCSSQCIEKVMHSWKPVWPKYADIQRALQPFAAAVVRKPETRAAAVPRKPVTHAAAVPREPETRAAAVPRKPETRAAAIPRKPETRAAAVPRKPETRAAAVPRKPETRAAAVPWEPEPGALAVPVPWNPEAPAAAVPRVSGFLGTAAAGVFASLGIPLIVRALQLFASPVPRKPGAPAAAVPRKPEIPAAAVPGKPEIPAAAVPRKPETRAAAVPRKPETRAAAVPRKLETHAAAVPGELATSRYLSMLLFGGYNPDNVLNTKLWNIELMSGRIEEHKMDARAVKYLPAYCSTPNRIFAIGGSMTVTTEVNLTPLSDCLSVSAGDFHCETWPDVPEPLVGVAAVCVDDAIYTFSGDDSYQAVYCLDLNTKQWTRCPNMPTRMAWPIIVSIRRHVFLIYNTIPYNDQFKSPGRVAMFSFDTKTLQWQTLEPLPASIPNTRHARAVRVEEDIYLVGGLEQLCARYSPLHNTWQTLSKPLLVHQMFSVCHLNGTIVLCGGSDKKLGVQDTIETYDIARNTWAIHRVRMPMALGLHHCAVYDEEKGVIVM